MEVGIDTEVGQWERSTIMLLISGRLKSSLLHMFYGERKERR